MNEDDLRRVLEMEASEVEVSPHALGTIRQRIESRRTRWVPRGRGLFALGTGGLVAVATVVTVFAGVGSCAPLLGQPEPPAASTQGVPVPSASAPTTAGPSASVSAGPTSQVEATVYVYYLADDSSASGQDQAKLYRESHTMPAGDGSPAARARAGLTRMFDGGTAFDSDYSSAWPATVRVRGVRVDGDVVVVDLTDLAQSPAGDAGQAVQQLIWTATANTTLDKVRILVDGAPVDELWGVPVRGDLRRKPAAEVQGLVWLISPQEGDTVGRTFEVHVYGSVFEATIAIRVRQGSRIVQETSVTVNAGAPAFGEGRITLTLPPGSYTLEAYEASARDGSVQHLDDHQITVR